jgi:L-glyceraldehyde 3-phosphate reductase
MAYQASNERYSSMVYRRCGNSGIQLPLISLGLWHNFGAIDDYNNCKEIVHTAFDHGITHFDLANNYGPPPGEAEVTFGKILKDSFRNYRDELIISSKAGWGMWPGPYGDWGSKKYLVASLDQSLKRMGLDYVDIFYHHRPDPSTPLEETMGALNLIVKQGKALYVGISSYSAEETLKAVSVLESLGTRLLIHQPKYSMLDRWVEKGLLQVLEENRIGCISFSSLAQGLLTNKYLKGIPSDSRVGRNLTNGAIQAADISESTLKKVKTLNELALNRGQTLAQMSIAWILKDKRITSIIIGASRKEQVKELVGITGEKPFSKEELEKIEDILKGNEP